MSEKGPRPEQSREELTRRLRESIVRNQDVLHAVPDDRSPEEYWETLRREGMPVTLRVREPDGSEKKAEGMYILDEQDDCVEVTYFVEDGIGERFSVEIERIREVG